MFGFSRITLLFFLVPLLISAAPVVAMVIIFGVTATMSSSWNNQCDSIVGPDPSVTQTVTPSTPSNVAGDSNVGAANPSDIPTTNPYAAMTTDPSNSVYENSCIQAMKTAPYQLPALQSVNASVSATCARTLALSQLGARAIAGAGSLSGPTGGGFGPPELTRYVDFVASAAPGTNQCDRHTTTSTSTAGVNTTESSWCGRTFGTGGSPLVLLPDTLSGQAMCGQRVSISGTSAGDLVFWDYQNEAPARVGVAVDNDQMVTCEPATGSVSLEPIPALPDVRVKRVLDATVPTS